MLTCHSFNTFIYYFENAYFTFHAMSLRHEAQYTLVYTIDLRNLYGDAISSLYYINHCGNETYNLDP